MLKSKVYKHLTVVVDGKSITFFQSVVNNFWKMFLPCLCSILFLNFVSQIQDCFSTGKLLVLSITSGFVFALLAPNTIS